MTAVNGHQVRTQGHITAWKRKAGYGFIRSDRGTYWAHIQEFKKTGPVNEDDLKEGASVSFTYKPGESSKGFLPAYDCQLEGQGQ